jgi:site-specific DNA-methyltransferase (adenine-specific)
LPHPDEGNDFFEKRAKQVGIERFACVREVHARQKDGPGAEIILGDAAAEAESLCAQGRAVQLIYIDPPFSTGQEFHFGQSVGEQGYKRGGPADRITHVAYTDRFEDGQDGYLRMMREVLLAAHRLLDARGSIYVHVDYRTSAHMRLLLDEVFGSENFINEIIWHYKSGGRATRHFSRKHDTIFLYGKKRGYRFNALFAASPRGTARRNHMKRQVDENGRTFFSIRSNGKLYKYYEDGPVYLSDVWDDISHLQQKDPERTLYDTQKPLALLERIIGVSSGPGDAVADLFCGSGTALEAAVKMGRSAVGVDASIHAHNVCRKRMLAADADFSCAHKRLPACPPARLQLEAGQELSGRVRVGLKTFCVRPPDGVMAPAPAGPWQLALPVPGDGLFELDLIEPGAPDGGVGLEAADYVALGYADGGVFYALHARARTRTAPELPAALEVLLPAGAAPALQVTDIYGCNHYFRLDIRSH